MTKYIDTDKLKAEIERYIKHYEKLERNDFQNGELYICQELLFFIDSLQKEQQEIDLEKEINSYCGTRDIRPVPDFMDAVAHHFYELGRNSK